MSKFCPMCNEVTNCTENCKSCMEEDMRDYWLVFKIKNGRYIYVSGTDEYGYPTHTEIVSEAWKFYNFDTAMSYFNLGYAVVKR